MTVVPPAKIASAELDWDGREWFIKTRDAVWMARVRMWIPTACWDPIGGRWQIPATPASLAWLRRAESQMPPWTTAAANAATMIDAVRSRRIERSRATTPLGAYRPFLMRLDPYQVAVGEAAAENPKRGFLLTDEVGVGKTPTALEIAAGAGGATLVVAPASLVLYWRDKVREWLGVEPSILRRGSIWPWPAGDLTPRITITSYERMVNRAMDLAEHPWRTIIFDEAHYLRNAGSQRSRQALFLREQTRARVVCLTATPVVNGLGDLETMLRLTDAADAIWGSVRGLREWGRREGEGVPAAERAQEFLRENGFLFRRTPAEVGLDFGNIARDVIPVDVSDTAAHYRQRQRAMREWLTRENWEAEWGAVAGRVGGHLEELRALAGLAKVQPVVEWAASTLGTVPRLKPPAGAASPPSAEVAPGRAPGDTRLVLFSRHHEVQDALAAAFRARCADVPFAMHDGRMTPEERAVSQERLRSGSARVLLTSLDVGGVGLDLTAANVVAFTQLGWHMTAMRQAEGRIDRRGQTRHVSSWWFVGEGTIDEHMLKVIRRKADVAGAFSGDPEMSARRAVVASIMGREGVGGV